MRELHIYILGILKPHYPDGTNEDEKISNAMFRYI